MRNLMFAMLFLLACGSGQSTRYAVVNRDSDIAPGAQVRMKGDVVGEVTEVALGPVNQYVLRLQLDPAAAGLIAQDATVSVKRTAIVAGATYLQIDPGVGAAASESDTLEAAPSFWDTARDKLPDLQIPMQLMSHLDSFRDEIGKAVTAGEAQWNEAKPKLVDRAQEITNLVRDTFPEAAASVQEQLESWLTAAEEALE